MTDLSIRICYFSNSHAYFRKHSRFARLGTLGFKTPCFRDLPSKNNTHLFFSVAYRLS